MPSVSSGLLLACCSCAEEARVRMVGWTEAVVGGGGAVADSAMNLLRQLGVFKASPRAGGAVVQGGAGPPPRAEPLWALAGAAGPWVRLAGVSGAGAVVLGAMGAHRTYPDPKDAKEDLRKIFDTANRFHFLHSLALVTVPLCRRPAVSGVFFVVGMTLFCGTCYYHAFTGDRTYRRLTPIGGTCLILGWLAMIGFESILSAVDAWLQHTLTLTCVDPSHLSLKASSP